MILFKYKSTDHLEDVIINKRLWCSRYDALNDPMEWAFVSRENYNTVIEVLNTLKKEDYRICCLSKSEQYGLMWSIYGDEHRGVCIDVEIEGIMEYSPNNPITNGNWIYKDVEYDKEPAQINSQNNTNSDANNIETVLFKKSKQWEHEQEVRFVKKLTNETDDNYMHVKINAIYLGKRMDKNRARNIKMLCDAFDVKHVDLSEPENELLVNYWGDYNNKPIEN